MDSLPCARCGERRVYPLHAPHPTQKKAFETALYGMGRIPTKSCVDARKYPESPMPAFAVDICHDCNHVMLTYKGNVDPNTCYPTNEKGDTQ